ncbi:hypothetical protein [Aureibacter tunicatorum]|uniref:Uncharacterized protein n=1 Tax=Aureibacter tunicatorum TaxID=866807 RepID=A0AAE3XND7_9BACT|nr:hypothetical protein [Aureibacter tunicatorum]MDR6241116.1 hypothetical protein [Aureibacter tunicatorum]BDD03894.1 hypothetical protein AUTU_13770 [Aureibacter tunicatorum]
MKKHKTLFLLEREISPYTAENLFLGIFESLDVAKNYRNGFIEKFNFKDPFKEQAYKKTDLTKDLKIIEIQDKIDDNSFFKQNKSVFLLCGIFEMFGQIKKELILLSSDKLKIEKIIQDQKDSNYLNEEEYSYYKLEELKLNN